VVKRPERTLPSPFRFLLILAGIAALLFGIWAGLWRLGWKLPLPTKSLPISHGPLMVSGFLGTLISLERAVALNKVWNYLAPVFTAIGTILLLSGVTHFIAPLFIVAGSLILTFIFFSLFGRESELHFAVMGVGANLWLVGNIIWLRGFAISHVVLWWMGFLVLTIVGERIELSRILMLKKRARALISSVIAVFIIGTVISLVQFDAGTRIAGAGMMLMALWLLWYDMARRTLRNNGLTRYMAIALYVGYIWLFIGGLLAVILGGVVAGPAYDAMLHTIFVGYVFSMIFGHAPIIFPVVLKLPVSYRPSFYVHLVLLHLSLILRIIGDMVSSGIIREWGGLLNGIAIILFLYNTITSILDKKFTPSH